MNPPQNAVPLEVQLGQLREDPAFRPFRPMVEGVDAVASTKSYGAATLNAVAASLVALHAQVSSGATVDDVIEQAKNVRFDNPDLTADQVQQAATIFNIYLDKVVAEQAKPPLSVPVVLVVMSRKEAASLSAGAAMKDQLPSAGEEFEQVRQVLQASAPDWLDRYGERPQDWRPFGTTQADQTVESLVNSVVAEMNAGSKYDPPLAPIILDIAGLMENWSDVRALRQNGCVLLVDSISMLHPAVHENFQRCGLDLFPKVSVVRIEPKSVAWETARTLKLVFRVELNNLEFVRRSTDYGEDPYASSEANDAVAFTKWMRSRVFALHPAPGGIHAQFKIIP